MSLRSGKKDTKMRIRAFPVGLNVTHKCSICHLKLISVEITWLIVSTDGRKNGGYLSYVEQVE